MHDPDGRRRYREMISATKKALPRHRHGPLKGDLCTLERPEAVWRHDEDVQPKLTGGGRPAGANVTNNTRRTLLEELGPSFTLPHKNVLVCTIDLRPNHDHDGDGYSLLQNVYTVDPLRTPTARITESGSEPLAGNGAFDVDFPELVTFENSLGVPIVARVLAKLARLSSLDCVGIGNAVLPGMASPLQGDTQLLLIEVRQLKGTSLSGGICVPIDLFYSSNRSSKANAKFNVSEARQAKGMAAAISLFIEHDSVGDILHTFVKLPATLLFHSRSSCLMRKTISIPL